MKKQSLAEGLPQKGVPARTIGNVSADNVKSNASCIHNDEDWNELAELIISFADGFSAELQKITNQEKRQRKMAITLSLLVCAGILTAYAARKVIISRRKKTTLNRRAV